MIIQTAPAGSQRVAIMMHEHTALSGQLARAFGNAQFQAPDPFDLVVYAISNHDAGWAAFDRDPATDPATGLPYNLVETPAQFITVTSRLSPDFNQRHHAYSGLLSSMHSWGLYNGRYGFSSQVPIRLPGGDKALADQMLAAELERQATLKAAIASNPASEPWLEEARLFQAYKQLQFCDLLALYFNRVHPSERGEHTFEHVPFDAGRDGPVAIRPVGEATYALSPFPFGADGAEFAYAGRPVSPGGGEQPGGWPVILRQTPTVWERFRLVAG